MLVEALVATPAQADLWPHQHDRGAVAFGVVVLALGLAVVWGRHLLGRARTRASLIALGVGAGTLLCAAAAAGYPWQQRYLRHWYAPSPKTSDLAPVWGYFRHIRDARIAVVGTYGEFLLYPLLGRDDSNRVDYVAHVGPHGSFTPITSCREFRLAVDAGHFDYLITTPTRNFWVPHQLFYAPEGSWTASDPAARVLMSYLVAGRRVSVFGLTGPLDPSACP